MIGDWEVRVVGTQPDGTQAVMDENMFNDPPEEGRQFFLVSIEATYHGPDSDSLWLAVTFRAVDDAGVAYSGFEDRCGVVPNDLQSLNEVFTGGTIEGNECWSVRSDHVDSLVMYAEEFISFTDDSRLFFSLRQDG